MNNKRKKIIFIGAAIGVILIAAAVVYGGHSKPDTRIGLQKLKQMEKVEVSKVDKKIQALEKTELEATEEWQNRTPDEKFANVLLLGDSITQGLYEYEVLSESHVKADRGTAIYQTDGEKVRRHVAAAKDIKPQVLFMCYGMNDVEEIRTEQFIEAYRSVVKELKEALPDTKIYINSVLPVNESALKRVKGFENIPEYNEALKVFCEEEGLTFVDNTSLVDEKSYDQDGIHMKPDFYKKWVDHMAEAADL